jgi:hypothetical protein
MSDHQTDIKHGVEVAQDTQDDKIDSELVVLDTLIDERLESGLGIWQTAMRNKHAILYATLACCGVMSEGSVQIGLFIHFMVFRLTNPGIRWSYNHLWPSTLAL